MSKERARRRAERESLAERRRSEQLAARQRQLAKQRRRGPDSRLSAALGRRGRTAASARTKERRAVIASTLLVVLVLTYLMTRSISMVIGVMLIAAIATPAIATAVLGRSKK